MVKQWNQNNRRSVALRVGDKILTASSFSGVHSILVQLRAPGPLVLHVVRGPFEVCEASIPDDFTQSGLQAMEQSATAACSQAPSPTAEHRHDMQQNLQERRQLQNQRELDDCNGQNDLQNLLARRLATSMLNRS